MHCNPCTVIHAHAMNEQCNTFFAAVGFPRTASTFHSASSMPSIKEGNQHRSVDGVVLLLHVVLLMVKSRAKCSPTQCQTRKGRWTRDRFLSVLQCRCDPCRRPKVTGVSLAGHVWWNISAARRICVFRATLALGEVPALTKSRTLVAVRPSNSHRSHDQVLQLTYTYEVPSS